MKVHTDHGMDEVILIVTRKSGDGVDRPIMAINDQRIIRALVREVSQILGASFTGTMIPKHP